jgi:hypothetical protein
LIQRVSDSLRGVSFAGAVEDGPIADPEREASVSRIGGARSGSRRSARGARCYEWTIAAYSWSGDGDDEDDLQKIHDVSWWSTGVRSTDLTPTPNARKAASVEVMNRLADLQWSVGGCSTKLQRDPSRRQASALGDTFREDED